MANVAVTQFLDRNEKWTRGVLKQVTYTSASVTADDSQVGPCDFMGCDKITIQVENAGTNTCTWNPQGSQDGVYWQDLAYSAGASASPQFVTTSEVTAADEDALFFLAQEADYVRYIRIQVDTANALGTVFKLYGNID